MTVSIEIECDECYANIYKTDGIEQIDKDVMAEINSYIKDHVCENEEEDENDD